MSQKPVPLRETGAAINDLVLSPPFAEVPAWCAGGLPLLQLAPAPSLPAACVLRVGAQTGSGWRALYSGDP